MKSTRFRNTEVRLSAALTATRAAVGGRDVTLREMLQLVGEQGLLVFCALLAVPMLLPIPLPMMSYALGIPILLIGLAVASNQVPWLPERLLDHRLPGGAVDRMLERAIHAALRFEHLVKPRLAAMTATPAINAANGAAIAIAAVTLLVPLPFVPLTNALPGLAILLLSLGMAERDGILILLGHTANLLAIGFVGGAAWLVVHVGRNPHNLIEAVESLWQRLVG